MDQLLGVRVDCCPDWPKNGRFWNRTGADNASACLGQDPVSDRISHPIGFKHLETTARDAVTIVGVSLSAQLATKVNKLTTKLEALGLPLQNRGAATIFTPTVCVLVPELRLI